MVMALCSAHADPVYPMDFTWPYCDNGDPIYQVHVASIRKKLTSLTSQFPNNWTAAKQS